MKIIYMGTPDFAVPALEVLLQMPEHQVVAVVTMPDKPVGRHQSTLSASPVKQCALAHGIPVLQPVRLKDEAFLQTLRTYAADLFIVVAFRMLPEAVWSMPPRGTFNLHAALLPQYRGAAPINWAIINGERETGCTTFFLDRDIDTGAIIARRTLPIADTDDAGTVHDALMTLGAELVQDTVRLIASGDVKPVPQSQFTEAELHPAPKIFKETCRIRWSQGVRRTYDFIRGLSPYPAAWTNIVYAPHVGANDYLPNQASGRSVGANHICPINEQSANATSGRSVGANDYLPNQASGRSVGANDYLPNQATAKSEPATPIKVLRTEKVYASHTHATGTIIQPRPDELLVAVPDGYLRLLEIQPAGKRRMTVADFLRGQRDTLLRVE